jgi:hypothetical protein
LLHAGRLKINKNLADVEALVGELQEFRAQVTDSGRWTFGARGSAHDDLVLALAIALWRAHGDSMGSPGIFEYYKQTYGNGAEAKPQAESPPEPPQEDPFGFYLGPNGAAPADVTLKAPTNVSSATGLSGRSYLPAHGLFTMTEEDAKVFISHGWTRVQQQEAN